MTIADAIPANVVTRLPVKLTATGLTIEPGTLSPSDYLQLCADLKRAHNASIWWWGDSLNAFERDWGEMYTQALEESDYAYQTLANAKWVCSKVHSSVRTEKLGFTAHTRVAALDRKDQIRLLRQAQAEDWTDETLRLAVRQERDPFAEPAPEPRVFLENEATWPASFALAMKVASGEEPGPSLVAAALAEQGKANHQLINASTNNEWYTPAPFLRAAHDLMGGIDLDPASTPFANKVVRAARIFTEDDDGLSQRWEGRIWLNPPYGIEEGESNQAKWSRRLIESYRSGAVTEALLLVNAVTGNQWFAPLKDFPICFPDARIRFYNEDTEAGQPTHSNAIVYFGPQVERFAALFGRFGAVLATREVWDACR